MFLYFYASNYKHFLPKHPITFTEFYRQMALDGLIQDVKLEPHPHPITDLMHFLKCMMDGCVQPCTPPSTM